MRGPGSGAGDVATSRRETDDDPRDDSRHCTRPPAGHSRHTASAKAARGQGRAGQRRQGAPRPARSASTATRRRSPPTRAPRASRSCSTPLKHAKTLHGGGKAACVDCHADEGMRKYPHKSPKPAQCASCHEKAVKEYATTIHGMARADGRMVAATCSRLPRHARHQGHFRRWREDRARQPRGDLRRLPRQREAHQGRQDPGRQRLGDVPRQHPRQAPAPETASRRTRCRSAPTATARTTCGRRRIPRARWPAPTFPRPAAPATAR